MHSTLKRRLLKLLAPQPTSHRWNRFTFYVLRIVSLSSFACVLPMALFPAEPEPYYPPITALALHEVKIPQALWADLASLAYCGSTFDLAALGNRRATIGLTQKHRRLWSSRAKGLTRD